MFDILKCQGVWSFHINFCQIIRELLYFMNSDISSVQGQFLLLFLGIFLLLCYSFVLFFWESDYMHIYPLNLFSNLLISFLPNLFSLSF